MLAAIEAVQYGSNMLPDIVKSFFAYWAKRSHFHTLQEEVGMMFRGNSDLLNDILPFRDLGPRTISRGPLTWDRERGTISNVGP